MDCHGTGRRVRCHRSGSPRPCRPTASRRHAAAAAWSCAGQRRLRNEPHEGTRSDGSVINFTKPSLSFDLRIPAVPEIARLVGCRAITKRNWLVWQGQVFSRVRSCEPVTSVPTVVDLLVDGDESYMTAIGLAHNGGKRKGAACVYLEPWHADIEEFLELRDNTGD